MADVVVCPGCGERMRLGTKSCPKCHRRFRRDELQANELEAAVGALTEKDIAWETYLRLLEIKRSARNIELMLAIWFALSLLGLIGIFARIGN